MNPILSRANGIWQNSNRREGFFSGTGDYLASRFEARAVTRAIPGGFSRVPPDKAAKVRANGPELAKLPTVVTEYGTFLSARTYDHTVATF